MPIRSRLHVRRCLRRPARRARRSYTSSRLTHRVGPVQITLSSRASGLFLRLALWGTGLWWETALFYRSRRRDS